MKLKFTMFTRLSSLSAILLCAGLAHAQNEKGYRVIDQTDQATMVSFTNPTFSQRPVDVNGQQMSKITTLEGAPTLEMGMPDLPRYSQSIAIPNRGATKIEVTYSSYNDIKNVFIAPSKGNLTRNINPEDVPYQFGDVYKVDAFYPGKLAELSSPFILRDHRGQTITTHPFQYNP